MATIINHNGDQINTTAKYDDGVVSGRGANRWQKYGNDRLYIGDGYIDLTIGRPVGDLGSDVSDVSNVKFEFDEESDTIKVIGYNYNNKALCKFAEIPKDKIVN